ncbi:vicilin-like seed storage protein At2g18540 [Amaranthus tricolor]|uniref:vicilin-like seed storage protein At2g18540 n=1 Tax=Amaranthus tricolor TaxID=29722 RepID=UPI0025884667|nr:vicilin-like seed storage protein At2g18540 [Amaranthus tricolor]
MKPPFLSIFLLLSLVSVVKLVSGGFSINEEIVPSGRTGTIGRLVKRDERTPIAATELGEILSVDIDDGTGKGKNSYHLQFISLEPNALFLPVLLHADMVFYVQTGIGEISWTESDKIRKVSLREGDVYSLKSGSLFYIHSSTQAEKMIKIIAIFDNPEEAQLQGPLSGPYTSINDLVQGFDKTVLQSVFQVPEEVIKELLNSIDTQPIVHAEPKKKNLLHNELLFVNRFLGIQGYGKKIVENKKKNKPFNVFKEDPDSENHNGWSTVVTEHNLEALHGSNIGAIMVNLTKASMVGPHWNPVDSEVSVVLEGEGMVRVVCPSLLTNKECKNSRFRVEKGDVFTVPRFHPMMQTSFNNGPLVFIGFSTILKKSHLEFLAGKESRLQALSQSILRASFNVPDTTIQQLLHGQEKQKEVILECTSCAEEQERMMEEDIEQEEGRPGEGEAAGRREEDEHIRPEEHKMEPEITRPEKERREFGENGKDKKKKEKKKEKEKEKEKEKKKQQKAKREQKAEEEEQRKEKEEEQRKEKEEEEEEEQSRQAGEGQQREREMSESEEYQQTKGGRRGYEEQEQTREEEEQSEWRWNGKDKRKKEGAF